MTKIKVIGNFGGLTNFCVKSVSKDFFTILESCLKIFISY